MLCQKCHKNTATVRYAEVVDGKVADLHLCADCLSDHQDQADRGFELSGLPSAAVMATRAIIERDPGADREMCRFCETSLATVLTTGKVGCIECYSSFGEKLAAILEGLHGSAKHRGKLPQVDDARERVRGDLQTKRSLLRSALNTENYEDAASLRDDIRTLESGLRAFDLGHE
jgi:protein arginine kinase activator